MRGGIFIQRHVSGRRRPEGAYAIIENEKDDDNNSYVETHLSLVTSGYHSIKAPKRIVKGSAKPCKYIGLGQVQC
jgi:hypothetical protein